MNVFLAIAAILISGLIVLNLRSKNVARQSLCLICEESLSHPRYCDEYSFCQEHFNVYKDGEWVVLSQGSASAGSPDFGVELYETKGKLVGSGIPSFIQASYEEESGNIVTKMKLLVLKQDLEKAQALSKSFLS
ncbi:MAG: hypothetical protein WD025_07450 [Bacteriovoracaceae bacterium]